MKQNNNIMLNPSVPKGNCSQCTVWYWENYTLPELISQEHPQWWAVISLAGLVHSTLGDSIPLSKG